MDELSQEALSTVPLEFNFKKWPKLTGIDGNMPEDIRDEYERLQRAEIDRICFLELKVVDFLILSLNQVQKNLRNILH
jgi:hypothetical protein